VQPAPAAPADPAIEVMKSFRESITDPKLKNVADRLTSPTDAIKAIVDLRTQNSQMIRIPGEGATDDDKAKYRKALGIPEKEDGYKIELPAGMEMTDADKAVLNRVMPIAFKNGVPQTAFNGFVADYLALQRDMQAQVVSAIKQFGDASEAKLKKEWGADYEPNLNLANRVGEVYGGQEFKEFLNTTPLAAGGMIGDHPMIVKFLATLGRRTDEGDLLLSATREEKSSIQDQINQLNKEVPPGTPAYASKAHQDKLSGLYGKLHGHQPIVGSAQRVA